LTSTSERLDGVVAKTRWRLIPFMLALYILAFLDRSNIGFAKQAYQLDTGLSNEAFALGAGIFFVAYAFLGTPANLMMKKVGARRWIGFTTLVWGVLSAAMAFADTEWKFLVVRTLLGAAEAGFFPGIVLYLTKWFPSARRGGVMALFMSAIPLSGVLGGPFSGWILGHFTDGQAGMHAWQWLFLLQGLPTVVLGIGILAVLSNGIDDARFLSSDEKAALKQALVEDDKNRPTTVSDTFAAVIRNKGVWALGVIYFSIQSGVYMINFWLPSIIKASGQTDPALVGWLSAIPYLAASVFMLYVGRSADRHRERRLHLAVPMLMGVGGLLVAANFSASPTIALIGLTIATMGALTGLPMFWPISGGYLSPTAAAGGLALINSIGQIAGFVSPYMVGWIKDATQSTDTALYILAAIILVGVVLVLRIPGKLVNR